MMLAKENSKFSLLFSQSKERPALRAILDKEDLVHTQAHVYIRYGADSVDIRQQLGAAEAIAEQSGHSLVVAEASPIAIDEIAKWAVKLRANGFQLAPASALAK